MRLAVMCILFYTISHPGYQLILASNRDEYFERPALPARWHTFANDLGDTDHEGDPWVLSGRDLGSLIGGTWLGMTRDLRIGIVTNIRIPPSSARAPSITAPSRGLLLKSFLSPPPSPDNPSVKDFLTGCFPRVPQYEGFNLLLFKLHKVDREETTSEVGYLTNRPAPAMVDLGGQRYEVSGSRCHGLSNTPMEEPWPKVIDGEQRMSETLRRSTENGEGEDALLSRMMEILQQTIPLNSLHDAKLCTCLQPVLIGKKPEVPLDAGTEGRWYGTRVSTVILVKDNGDVTFVERDIGERDGQGGVRKGTNERVFRFNTASQESVPGE